MEGILCAQILQNPPDTDKAKSMLVFWRFRRGNLLPVHHNGRRSIADGNVQAVRQEDAAPDHAALRQSDTALDGIVQQIGKQHHQGIRFQLQPGQIVDPELEIHIQLLCRLIFLIQHRIQNGMMGIHPMTQRKSHPPNVIM